MKLASIYIITALLSLFLTSSMWVYHYPLIGTAENDSLIFIRQLYSSFNIDTPFVFTPGNITQIDTILLYGSDTNFLIIEYSYPDGPMSDYPWKIQFLITTDHKPVNYFQANRYELIEVFPDQHPLLLILNVTGKGNGWHEIYRMKNNNCINICEPDEFIKTYDAHTDYDIFDPPELQLTIEDCNGNGFNDLIFKGTRQYYDPPERIETIKMEPVKYIFLYNPEKEVFELTE
ncbi:MAG: hypothetical protein LUG98_07965 [Tannerellaceae bacterium]|nr:hypothetical protein [Tannerellaceae bacterium]